MFQLSAVILLMPLEVNGHTVPHWKDLSSGKYESKWLRCGITLTICQTLLKSANLFHKLGTGLLPMASIVKVQDVASAKKSHPLLVVRISIDKN